jgi:hypothetical protein
MDIEHAVAVRVCCSLHENATSYVDLENSLDAAGIGGLVEVRPGVTTPSAAFSTACRRVKRRYRRKDVDTVRYLQTTMLSGAGRGSKADTKEVKYAVNVAEVVDDKTNDLAQVGWFSYDPKLGTTTTHTKPDPQGMFSQEDITQFHDASQSVELYTLQYGGTCTSNDLRTWITKVCEELNGWMHIGQKGDYIVLRRPELGDSDPGKILLKLKEVVEGLNPQNIVSVMPLFPDPSTEGELRTSAQHRVQQEIKYAIAGLQTIREGGKFKARGLNSQLEKFNELQARVDFYARSLEFRAESLDELITGAKTTLDEMRAEIDGRNNDDFDKTLRELEEEL